MWTEIVKKLEEMLLLTGALAWLVIAVAAVHFGRRLVKHLATPAPKREQWIAQRVRRFTISGLKERDLREMSSGRVEMAYDFPRNDSVGFGVDDDRPLKYGRPVDEIPLELLFDRKRTEVAVKELPGKILVLDEHDERLAEEGQTLDVLVHRDKRGEIESVEVFLRRETPVALQIRDDETRARQES